MALLEVTNIKKIYSTRFGGNKVQALSNVSFSIEKGEFVAIMGESGSGKIVHLTEKEISAFRRKNLGFVFQDFNLLDTFSLRDNIYLPLVLAGEDYREMEQKIRPIAQALCITELLDKYPYEVSGGQKQRLCIARALLKKPKILILDDSTSAVDTKTDALIRKAFREEIPDTTKIIIAQRVSSIEDADQIIVLDDGKIAGVGTSEELLQTNEIYREVYESQVKGGEEDE